MAKIPASFIKNYVAQHGANNKFAQATSPPAASPAPVPANSNQPSGKPARVPKPKKPKKPARPVKKKHGFFRRALGAVAREVFKGSGHIGKEISRAIHEDAMGSGGMPTNNASSGAVSGLGTGSQEPGVKPGKKTPRLTYKMFKRTRRAVK